MTFRFLVVKLIEPTEKLLLTVISRLVNEPLVITRPFVVLLPNVTPRLPMLGMATDAVPLMVKL